MPVPSEQTPQEKEMRYLPIALAVVCLCASSAVAQSTGSAPYPKFEIFAGYSINGYFKNDEAPGPLNNRPVASLFSDDAGGPKGFEASIARNLNRYLGIKGDFSMYFDSGPGKGTFTICSDSSCTTSSQDFHVSKRAFYFMAGPEIKWRNKTRVTPYAHALFGVARSTAEFSTASSVLTRTDSDTRVGFAAAFGGGLDIRLSKRFSIRSMMDYTAAFLGEADGRASGRQNHVRISVGIVFGK
jgi:opacity protein-like surface antigen